MEVLIPVVVLGVFLWTFIRRNHKEEETEYNPDEYSADGSMSDSAQQSAEQTRIEMEENLKRGGKPDTFGLMFSTLSLLGCQPVKNDDGTISVSYQGENFHMEFGGMYCRVWDPVWSAIKVDDPNLPNVREAVNAANFNFGPTVVLTRPNEEGVINIHSRQDIMLHPACPDNVYFVKAILDSFFETKENVRSSYQQLNMQQMEAQKKRRPVGFTTNSDTPQSEE